MLVKHSSAYVLRQGRVAEEGSFSMLSAKPGGILNGMITVQQSFETEQLVEVA